MSIIDGTPSDDTLAGTAADDTINGYAGNDLLKGNEGTDTLYGGDGNDTLFGASSSSGVSMVGDGADFLYGGAGNDVLRGNAGDDFFYGGADNDNLRGDFGSDLLDGGDGYDFASYLYNGLGLTAGVTADRSAINTTGTWTFADGLGGTDTTVGIEKYGFSGTQFADTYLGSQLDDQIQGNGGDDTLQGNGGDDTYFYNATVDGSGARLAQTMAVLVLSAAAFSLSLAPAAGDVALVAVGGSGPSASPDEKLKRPSGPVAPLDTPDVAALRWLFATVDGAVAGAAALPIGLLYPQAGASA